jgi:polysaccharide export outer membrane protein
MMNRTNKHKIALYFLAISIFFCFNPPSLYSQGKEFIRLRSTSQGTPTKYDGISTMRPSPEYYISPGDKIEIFVWQNPDLTRDVQIRDDGKLSYPLIGTLKAEGLTIDQLQDEIKTRLSEYVRAPQVTISVKEAAGKKIVILGQVNYPGVYTFNGTLDVIEAVAMAGDFTPDGRRESIMIISDNLTEHPKVRRLTAIRQGMMTEEFVLKPNDVVYVPRSTIADFNKFLNDIAPTINTLSNLFMMGTNSYNFAVDTKAWFMHRDLKVVRGD